MSELMTEKEYLQKRTMYETDNVPASVKEENINRLDEAYRVSRKDQEKALQLLEDSMPEVGEID